MVPQDFVGVWRCLQLRVEVGHDRDDVFGHPLSSLRIAFGRGAVDHLLHHAPVCGESQFFFCCVVFKCHVDDVGFCGFAPMASCGAVFRGCGGGAKRGNGVQKLVRFLSVEQVSAFSGYELLQIEGLVVGNVFCLVQRQGAFGQGQHV